MSTRPSAHSGASAVRSFLSATPTGAPSSRTPVLTHASPPWSTSRPLVRMRPSSGIQCFAGDLSAEEQGVVYATHFAPALDLFTQKQLDVVAWRSKPSWYIVATEERTVHPDLQRFAAKRMGAKTVELKSSHVPMLSQPR